MATEAQMAALKKARKALAQKQGKTTTATKPSVPRPSSIRKETVYDWNQTDLAEKRFGGQGTFEAE